MEKYKVPRIAFINKMDRVGADFSAAIESMKKRLDAKAKAIFLPIIEENNGEEAFIGMIDLVKMEAVLFDPEDSSGNSFISKPSRKTYLKMLNLNVSLLSNPSGLR